MGQVAITIMDKSYRLVCDDGDEDRLAELAAYVKTKIDYVRAEVGNAGDERLFLMAALLISDELLEKRSVQEASTSNEVEQAVDQLRAAADKMAAPNREGVDPPTAATLKPRKRQQA